MWAVNTLAKGQRLTDAGRYLAQGKRYVAMACATMLLAYGASASATVAEAINRPALATHLGSQATLLAASHAGTQLIAVGERGLILRSDDQGNSWQQLPAPVSVTLTAVSFFDAKHGYAVGHGGIVLHTADGGGSWQRVLDGRQLAQDLLQQANQLQDQAAISQAHLLVSDGPDKPFLDLLVLSPTHLIVVGAYGLIVESTNAGQSWQSWAERIDNPLGLHLYRIRKLDNRILLAGEQGFAALSENNGLTFTALEPPYDGSFFTAELLADNRIMLAGLRGNAFVSENGSWHKLTNSSSASITGSALHQGQPVLVNQAGMVLGLQQRTLVAMSHRPLPPLTGILALPQGGFLMLSTQGPAAIEIGEIK